MLGILTWLAVAPQAAAMNWTPGDYGGADIWIFFGDVVHAGEYVNVGRLVVPHSEVAWQTGSDVRIYAEEIWIDGIWDASAAGATGGLAPTPVGSPVLGQDGNGLGGGRRGNLATCHYAAGGGGAGHGGGGGPGGSYSGLGGSGGSSYGNTWDPFDLRTGSGGGGGASTCTHRGGRGGNGGGAVLFVADTIFVDGYIYVSGEHGGSGTGDAGGGGGGSGGTIVLVANHLDGYGGLVAEGGRGGVGNAVIMGGGAGGGGAGGRIKTIRATGFAPSSYLTPGTSGSGYYWGWSGAYGTENHVIQDLDADGITDLLDNCPTTPNASQADSDGDYVGDACDICPGHDDFMDSDGDGVPDGCDICPGGNDHIDLDADGIPDDCDPCIDVDEDGHCDDVDCNDMDPAVHPGAPETCNGIDDDCDGLVDDEGELAPGHGYTLSPDLDGDGWGGGGPDDVVRFCEPVPGYGPPGDCDDTDPEIHPDAFDFPDDGIDQDCDGEDARYDSDGDGIPDHLEHDGDFDGDGIPDYLDPDSDNDGVWDGAERDGYLHDDGSDGIHAAPALARYGFGCATATTPPQGFLAFALTVLLAILRGRAR